MSSDLFWNQSQFATAARARRYRQVGRVIWFTGLSGSRRSTITSEVERRLHQLGRHVYLLDGDNLRHGLCSDFELSTKDRTANTRRASDRVDHRAAHGELKNSTGVSAPYEAPINAELVLHLEPESMGSSALRVRTALAGNGDMGVGDN